MAGLPGVNVALPERATQTVAAGLVRGSSAVATSLVTSGFFLALCGAAYFLVRKFITAYRHSHLVNEVGADSASGLAIGYAQRLYTAMNSGYAWWNDVFGDGTDEEAMYQVAREMHQNKVDFSLVSSKYKTLYNRELIDDLTSELGSEEIAKFQTSLSTGLGGLNGLRVDNGQLYTTSPTVVFDAQLNPLGEIPGRVLLGQHIESLSAPSGQLWLGFAYGHQKRFVSALAVSRLYL